MRKKTVGNGDQLDSEMATFASRLGVPVTTLQLQGAMPHTGGSAPRPVIGSRSALAIVVHSTFLHLVTPLVLLSFANICHGPNYPSSRSAIQKSGGPKILLECGPMPNVMAALPNIGGGLCSTLQSLTDAHY